MGQYYKCMIGDPKDYQIESDVMNAHQKSSVGNSLIQNYMERDYRVPEKFEDFVYVGLVMLGYGLRQGLETHRRHRPYCMGSLYWQINDCWPVASWSSIDYYGRWKALHYAAKRFHAPVLMSVEDSGTNMRINVSNETMVDFKGTVKWYVKDTDLNVISEGEITANTKSLTARYIGDINVDEWTKGENKFSRFFVAELYDENGEYISKQVFLICKPKHFEYKNAPVKTEVKRENGKTVIYLSSDAFIHHLEISFEKLDTVLSDNFFSITDKKPIRIEVKGDFSAEEIEKQSNEESATEQNNAEATPIAESEE